jgi:O-antigen ligase
MAEVTILDFGTKTGEEGGNATSRALGTATVCGLGTLLVFAVLSFGAVEEWAVLVVEAGAAVLFLMWAARQLLNGRLDIAPNPMYWPMLVFAALIGAQALGLSAYPYATRVEGLRYVAYGLMFFVAAQTLRTARRQGRFLAGLAAFGFAVALLALAQHFTSPARIYWLVQPAIAANIFGPYVNHNHYAGLMEMLIPLPIVLSFNRSRSGAQRALLAFAAVIMGTSLLLSRSRGGIIAFVIQMFLMAGLLARARRDRWAALRLGGLALLIAAMLFWLDTGSVVTQLKSLRSPLSPAVSGNRIVIAKDSVRMFLDRPLAGWGLDTFPIVYPRYRSFATDVFINAAHNDYVQLMAEGGLVGTAATLWFLLVLFRAGMRKPHDEPGTDDDHVRVAAFVAVCGVLVHSLTDFNLHIPANAALFYVMCALAATPVLPAASLRFRKTRVPKAMVRP